MALARLSSQTSSDDASCISISVLDGVKIQLLGSAIPGTMDSLGPQISAEVLNQGVAPHPEPAYTRPVFRSRIADLTPKPAPLMLQPSDGTCLASHDRA